MDSLRGGLGNDNGLPHPGRGSIPTFAVRSGRQGRDRFPLLSKGSKSPGTDPQQVSLPVPSFHSVRESMQVEFQLAVPRLSQFDRLAHMSPVWVGGKKKKENNSSGISKKCWTKFDFFTAADLSVFQKDNLRS